MYLIGYDIGTSSVKASLLEAESGKVISSAAFPDTEMKIVSSAPGFAEQDPDIWWENLIKVTARLLSSVSVEPADIKAIGISYQMHGLILIDKNKKVLRPCILWCDSRAAQTGRLAAERIGPDTCLENLLNLPGNFTASKLRWVIDNEPDIYKSAFKMFMPGDYIAMKMTDEINTTISGISEGILWDFKNGGLSDIVLGDYGIDRDILADIVETFSVQGVLTKSAASQLGLKAGTPITYRAGDVPNTALSLNVLEPDQIAATAGTSGVICGIGEKLNYDSLSRVNSFAHVNYSTDKPRLSVHVCVNGAGILNSWLRANIGGGLSYEEMNCLVQNAPCGSGGLLFYPFGNGSERTLENKLPGSSLYGLQFNSHNKAHIFRAAQEGIVFAMKYGLDIMTDMGIRSSVIRAARANMFLSSVFRETFTTVTDCDLELYDTDGCVGAARGAGLGCGIYKSFSEAFVGLDKIETISPRQDMKGPLTETYHRWLEVLKKSL